jgi:hypothetical protein
MVTLRALLAKLKKWAASIWHPVQQSQPPKPPHGPPPASIHVWPLPILAPQQTAQAIAIIYNKKGDPMPSLVPTSWVSDNSAVASVDAAGLVTALAAGSANVTASYQSIASNPVAVTVTVDPNLPAAVVVSPSSLNLVIGQTAQLTATVNNSAGAPI